MSIQTWYFVRLAASLFAALSAAWITLTLARSVRIESSVGQKLRRYQESGEGKIDPELESQAKIGDRIGALLPISISKLEYDLEWAQRGDYYPGQRPGNVLFTGLLCAAAALVPFLVTLAPILAFLPLAGFYIPLYLLRRRANLTRRKTVRALPDITALVAAEVAAGTSAEQALQRAADLPGPLSGLLKIAEGKKADCGRPLFSRKPQVRGVLVDVFAETGLPELRAFAMQLDEVASVGSDSAKLMSNAARVLAREYRDHMMVMKEKLESKISLSIGFYFFFPAVALIMAAFIMPMLAIL